VGLVEIVRREMGGRMGGKVLRESKLGHQWIKGGKSVRVEVYCETEEGALEIQEQFGGTVRELKSRNWVAMSAPKGGALDDSRSFDHFSD
jgi:hypothetical protein